MFPQVAPKFFKTRPKGRRTWAKIPAHRPKAAAKQPAKEAPQPANASASHYVITLNGQEHKVIALNPAR